MVKKNRIVMLVLAAAVLVVVASGSASAAKFTGYSITHYSGPGDYGKDSCSYGNLTGLSVNSILYWNLEMDNNMNYDLAGWTGGNGVNRNYPYNNNGLDYNAHMVTVPANGPYSESHRAQVLIDDVSFYVDEYHQYNDGGRSYTVGLGTWSGPESKRFDTI